MDEILAFIGLQFISEANKMGSQPLLDLVKSLQLPHFRAAIFRDRLKLINKGKSRTSYVTYMKYGIS